MPQLHIRVTQQDIQGVALGDPTELGAIRRACQFIQLRPTLAHRPPLRELLLEAGYLPLILLVRTQTETTFRLLGRHFRQRFLQRLPLGVLLIGDHPVIQLLPACGKETGSLRQILLDLFRNPPVLLHLAGVLRRTLLQLLQMVLQGFHPFVEGTFHLVGGLASQQEIPLRTQAGIGLILLVVGFRGVLVLLAQGREESLVRLPFRFIGAPLPFQFPQAFPVGLPLPGEIRQGLPEAFRLLVPARLPCVVPEQGVGGG